MTIQKYNPARPRKEPPVVNGKKNPPVLGGRFLGQTRFSDGLQKFYVGLKNVRPAPVDFFYRYDGRFFASLRVLTQGCVLLVLLLLCAVLLVNP
jgi:hypothetical protein